VLVCNDEDDILEIREQKKENRIIDLKWIIHPQSYFQSY
jgi:hypothetical protein